MKFFLIIFQTFVTEATIRAKQRRSNRAEMLIWLKISVKVEFNQGKKFDLDWYHAFIYPTIDSAHDSFIHSTFSN